MKKTWFIALAVVVLAALTIGIAVPAFAGNGNGATADTSDGPAVVRVADALGITTTDLVTRLQSGETLAQIAAAQGVTEDAVIDALVSPYADQLALRVDNGVLTQEEADGLVQTARDNAASFLTQDLSDPGTFAAWHEQMEQYCEQYHLGNANRYGMNVGNGTGYGPGSCGMFGGWNDDGTRGNGTASQYGAGNRFGGNGAGGGMMGNRFGGGTGTCLATS